ncbi:MAG TPA: hypothetical protein VKU80_11765, partial [Planctomycetota bacterium]|nr:hypothetical protein [Planctomycetota bacterium]
PPVQNPFLSDTVEFYYPSEKIASEHVRRGVLPLVNRYIFGGAPVPHGIHIWNSIWPVKLIFLLLFDPIRSYDLFAIFHFWLAALAFYLFLRSLPLGAPSAIAAALAYALSGRAMLWLHGHYLMPTLAYVPLLFLAARRRSLLGMIPVAGLFFTNPQIGLAACAAVVLWERSTWRFVVPGILMAGVALVPLAVTILGGVRHPREEAGWFYRDGFRSWLWLSGLVAPGSVKGSMPVNEYNVYIGILPLVGAVAGARRERYFAAMAGIALALATLYPLPVWVSPVSFSLPTRYLYFFTFGACVCFGRALDQIAHRTWIPIAAIPLILIDLIPRFLAWNPAFDPALLRERPPAIAAVQGRTGIYFPQARTPFFPPLSIFGIESIQGYGVMVPRAQADALGGAGVVAGQRLIRLTDPENPALDRLGMRTLITDRSYESRRYRRVYDGDVRVYQNPYAQDVPPRPVSKVPLEIGLAVTVGACLWAAGGACLDRFRGQGYS